MIRATTGGVLRSYRSNLMNSFITLNNSRDTVLTQRTFNSYAEDPAAAAKAFRLRKSRMTVESQHTICSDVYKKYQTGWSCLDTISKLIDTDTGESMNTLQGTTLKMLNDPTGDAREQLTKALDQMSETIVQTLNQKYGDNFIFAGADGHNVPFEVKDNKLYYRGVSVDASLPKVLKDGADFIQVTADGEYSTAPTDLYLKKDNVRAISVAEYENLYTVPTVAMDASTPPAPVEYNADGTVMTGGDTGGFYMRQDAGGNDIGVISIAEYDLAAERAANPPQLLKDTAGNDVTVDENGVPVAAPTGDKEQDYYLVFDGEPKDQVISKAEYETAEEDVKKLEYLMNEKYFLDIGLGFQEDENNKLIESSGFNAALHGLTFIGYGLDEDGDPKNVYSIVQKLKEIGSRVTDGQDWTEADYDEFHALVGKLENASSAFKTEYTNMSASTTKLQNNLDLLEDNFYNLYEQYADLEDVDAADAITSFIWAQYSYNAALKVGNSILSQSLMDYLS